MERYALNETALCGYVTSYGRGEAAQALRAQAAPTLMIFARPLPSAMAMAVTGSGIIARLGRGLSAMALAAQARGYLLLCGIGDVALMALSALADGRMIPVARGTAVMTLQAAASGALALLGKGLARLSLDGAGRITRATQGQGEADQSLLGTLGIPRPVRIPDTFTPAHGSRRIPVASDTSADLVAPAERTLSVGAEPRIIHVATERH